MPPFKRTIKNRIRGVAWSLYGKFLRNPGFPENARKILFVCKGNICRSPFAELLSKQIMSRKVKSSCAYEFASVGIMLPDTKSPPTEAIHSARQFDVEMAMHHPKLINYSIMASSDMIIVMDVWQFKYLRKIFVEHSYKIFLLPLFENNREKHKDGFWKYNIVDPYGKSIQDFAECYQRMYIVLDWIIQKLISLRNNSKSNIAE